ncbi:hypothetical protein DM02DRAFT_575074 [Periconia macrospinosa]|uniref:Uncharacterized protein n=1 Tax=Periconia macrospinosa TaxID=97972 RepID=A0A2V1D4E1_9PLEO|nr:hypothetical protein DM02DRAFT_575074 [Periconia macrospinosa]
MSIPSSEGRRSVSPGLSASSSHTLASGYSGVDQHNGEASSAQRPVFSQRRSDASRQEMPQPHSPASTLSVEAIEERDFARRKERHRKSGGFLLDSFGSSLRNDSAHLADKKAKRGSRHSRTQERSHHHTRRPGEHATANSSPLSRQVDTTDRTTTVSSHRTPSPNMRAKANDNIHVMKRRSAHGIASKIRDRSPEPASAPSTAHAAIDPNQIVHMALNLSESRRRNLASGQLLIPQPRISSISGMDGSLHSQGTGGSLRQYLNDQRRASRNISPGGTISPGRHMSTSLQRSGVLLIQGRQPSPALLARRDKALAFFELRVEYLRLLEFLPPLRPDATEPGNFIVTANNVPGSPHVHLTRMPSGAGKVYSLGRPYNPLQFLRNRRLRARERKNLDHLPEEFANVDQVRDWVDRVEKESKTPQYRQTDGVILPSIRDGAESQDAPSQHSRPQMVWMFTSEELLADAHWLERNDNKTIIEDRYGNKIFPSKEPERQDFLQARPSKEYSEKRRKSWVEGIAGAPADAGTGDESETTSERGRKRRLLPTFRAESPKPKGHSRMISKVHTGAHTDSSDSDSDTNKWRRPRKSHKVVENNRDTGPLELRMKELLEKEAQETQAETKTPLIFTPDTPDKWGREQPDQNHSVRNSLEVPGRAVDGGRPDLDLGLKLPPTNRSHVHDATESIKESRSSFDNNNTAPDTPLHQKHFPFIDGNVSPSLSRAGSLKNKTKKSKLDLFRSDESSKHRHEHDHNHEVEINGLEKRQNSRPVHDETDESNGIGAAIWAAPGAVKNLLGHRKNDSVSSLQSPTKESRKESKEPKEPHSAVSRFLKGVKHEGSKVQEFIFRKDRPLGEYDTDSTSEDNTAPDTDTDDDAPKWRADDATSNLPSKTNNHYHLELPSFRSSQKNHVEEDEDYSDLSDHVTRQARERATSRSSRFDRLAPPRMDLSRISSKDSQRSDQDRINRILAHPGGVGRGGLPVTALANSDEKRTSSRPTLEGKRHWSITDENGDVIHRSKMTTVVTAAEIARVRALFLCSGVKAREIVRRISEVRSDPPAYLKRAAETANAHLYAVPRKEEHVLASRLLLNDFENSTSSLYTSASTFRDSTVKELSSLISTLTTQIESDLFPRVRNSGDEAVTITSDVNSTAPLTVKQVTDEIDRMLRMRRRRMRWVRRVGWTMVEWMLLSFMWFAWLTVTVFGAFGRVFGFFWNIVRWLLWI